MGGEGLPTGDRLYPVTEKTHLRGSPWKRSGKKLKPLPKPSWVEMDIEEIWRRYVAPKADQTDLFK